MKNILIVYYSRKGQNYWAGSIKNLPKGNTAVAAEFIQQATGGDIFEIDTVNPYPEDYTDCINQAKEIYFTQPEAWDALVRRDMEQDCSWDKAAKQYMEMYDSL